MIWPSICGRGPATAEPRPTLRQVQRQVDVPTDDGPASGRAADAVRAASAQLGDPDSWGAAGQGSFDRSGLTMYAWQAHGHALDADRRCRPTVGF